jgi:hypothetical protein
MTGLAAFVDAEGQLKAWANGLTGLVGVGNPLGGGIHLHRMRSPGKLTYGHLSRIGGYADTGDAPIDYARMSTSVYGMTQEAAALGAVAWANCLRALDGQPVALGAATFLAATSITGPLLQYDNDEPRYLVDFVAMLTPVP